MGKHVPSNRCRTGSPDLRPVTEAHCHGTMERALPRQVLERLSFPSPLVAPGTIFLQQNSGEEYTFS